MEQQQKAEIGRRIWELRENSRHTNESLARAVGVSVRAVGKWIEGGGISRANAEKVADEFKVDPDWLWSGRDVEASRDEVLDRLERIEAVLKRLENDRRPQG